MTDDLVRDRRAGSVATLTLNSPSTLNAPSDALMQALHDGPDVLAETPEIRAIALTTVKFISAEEAEGIAAIPDRRKSEWNQP